MDRATRWIYNLKIKITGNIKSWLWIWRGNTSKQKKSLPTLIMKRGEWTVVLTVEGRGRNTIRSKGLGCSYKIEKANTID